MPVPPPPHTGQSETVPKLSRRDATVPFSHSSIQPAEPEKPLGARISELLNDDGKSHLLRGVQLAEYLAQNHSNAFTLVAAFEATLDPEFLRQAAARFPDDPLVQAKILMHNALPAERQKWIDRLKQSSPKNSLPHLLSAVDSLASGDVNSALAKIMSTTGKTFNDFSREGMIGLEEAYRAAGHPPEEAIALSASELHLPALAPFKKLGSQLADLAGEYARAGDSQSQQRLLEGVWQTGSQLRESGRDGPLITDLVGLALQNITLQRWPENIPAPFLDVPVSTRLEMNQSFRSELRQTGELFGHWLPTAPDHEITSYYQRLRMLGEKEAMNWLKQRNPNFIPSNVVESSD